jgi:hypothetical protein
VLTVRLAAGGIYNREPFGEFELFYVLSGNIRPIGSNKNLLTDDLVAFTRRAETLVISALEDSEILEVTLREI